MDFIEKHNDSIGIIELSPNTFINHELIKFHIKNITIELNPFYWDDCEFILNKKILDTSFIEDWTRKWIDEDDLLYENTNGYSNAIHSVSIPEIIENETKFSIDFGTASSDCFFDLINKIAEKNIEKITIKSFRLIKSNTLLLD